MNPSSSHFAVRCRAAAVHFGLSVAIALLAALLVFWVWYPVPFQTISGGQGLFALVVGVDVLIGPLITLVIFNPSKHWRELRRDLGFIALVQVGALGYGLYTMAVARPVYLAHEVDRFRVVRAIDVSDGELAKAPPGFQQLPWWGPGFVVAVPPSDPGEMMKSIDLALTGQDISLRPETWVPYAEGRARVIARSRGLDTLKHSHPQRAAEVDGLANRLGLSTAALRVVPIVAREVGWVAVLREVDAEVVGYLDFGGLDFGGAGR